MPEHLGSPRGPELREREVLHRDAAVELAVKDTSDAVEKKYFEMLMAGSGEERLKMGCSMQMAAKAMARASILTANPTATESEIRKALFLRFYEHDFDAATRARILRGIGAE